MPYSPLLVKPFRDEVTEVDVQELLTPQDVDIFFNNQAGSALLFINSVCGCAAGTARPALRQAKANGNGKTPDRWVSVFAGQDLEATARARGYFPDIPPSSPSIALFKDGELVYFVPKHRIEGRDANGLANDLTSAFSEVL
jgi:putative YphP/YqiW family bacilliredoxin